MATSNGINVQSVDNGGNLNSLVGIDAYYATGKGENNLGVRPAIMLDRSKIAFVTGAVDSGITVGAALTAVDAAVSPKTLVFEDAALTLNAPSVTAWNGRAITFDYNGAAAGKTLSAVILDGSGAAIFYGRLAENITASGTATVNIPNSFADDVVPNLQIFVEDANGSYKTNFAGPRQTISFTVQTAPEGLAGVACTTAAQNDGKITGTTAAMEYSEDNGASWTDCSATETTGLVSKTYLVRTKGSDNTLASGSVSVRVGSFLTASSSDESYTWTQSGGFAEGYSGLLNKQFTITNACTQQLTGLTATFEDGTNFAITTALNRTTLATSGTNTATLRVQPKSGLLGSFTPYTDTLIIHWNDDDGVGLRIPLSFTVTPYLFGIGNTKYTSLNTAVAGGSGNNPPAVTDGGTIKLLGSVALPSGSLQNADSTGATKTFTIDLNDYTLTSAKYAVSVRGNIVTLKNGTIASAEGDDSYHATVQGRDGKLILENVAVSGKDSAVVSITANGDVAIKSGTFSNTTGGKACLRTDTGGAMALTVGSATTPTDWLNNTNAPVITVAAADSLVVAGVTAPVLDETPVTAVTETAYYTGSVAWTYGAGTELSGDFAGGTAYTATITLTPKAGYSMYGVGANFFTVSGATTVSNLANSGVITAVFPATSSPLPSVTNVGNSASVTYAGSTFDLSASALSGLFTIDENAGISTYSVETSGDPTGAGSVGADGKTLTVTKAGTFTIGLVTAATATHAAGAKVTATLTVGKGSQTAPSNLGKSDATTFGGSDGKITGLTASTSYEYKESGDTDYTAATSNASGEITVPAGSYVVRLAANDIYDESDDSTAVTIGQPAATYTATLTINKDGAAYAAHGKTFTLKLSGAESTTATMSGTDGTVTAVVPDGVWKVFDGSTDTGETITISGAVGSATLNYYSVAFGVSNAGAANGSTVGATYDGAAISSGGAVLPGKTLVITAVGAGADIYSYLWSGVGTNGEITAALTVDSLSAAVNASCAVTGLNYYAVTVLSAGAGATSGGSFLAGDSVAISAGTPPDGMRFKEWSASPTVTFADDTSASTTFEMIDSAVTVTANFELIPATVVGVTVNPSSVTVEKGTTYQFGATVAGTNNPAQTVTWTLDGYSGNSTIVDGLLTVTAASTLTGYESVSGSAVVTIAQPTASFIAVTGITGVPTAATVGTGLTLSGTVTPANATNQAIVWSVANANGTGASISGSTLTATAAGTATVTATITNGLTSTSDYTENFTITVSAATVTEYLLTVTNGTGGGSFAAGATVTITANAATNGQRFKEWSFSPAVTFANGTNKTSATAAFTMPSQAVTATAVYENIPAPPVTAYTITFDPRGGSVSPTTAQTDANGRLATLPTPTINGNYRFDGWFTAINGGGNRVTTSTAFNAHATVYALWTYIGDNSGSNPPVNDTPSNRPNSGNSYPSDANSSSNAAQTATSNVTETDTSIIIDFRDRREPLVPYYLAEKARNSDKTLQALMPDGLIVTFDVAALGTIDDEFKNDWRVMAKIAAADPLTIELSVARNGVYVANFKGGIATVNVPYTLPNGVRATQIVPYFVNAKGESELVTGGFNAETGNVDMILRHFSKYVIKVNNVKYTVGDGWFNADSLDFAVQRGLIAVKGGIVEPTGVTTRADFVIAVMKALGIQPLTAFTVEQFGDVGHLPNSVQAYLRTARELGIISGVGHNRFDPDSPALREHFFQIVNNIYSENLAAMPKIVSDKRVTDFADGYRLPAWAKTATNNLIRRGVIVGDGVNLQIGAAFNNATTAAMLMKLGGVIPDLPDNAYSATTAFYATEPEKQEGVRHSDKDNAEGDDA